MYSTAASFQKKAAALLENLVILYTGFFLPFIPKDLGKLSPLHLLLVVVIFISHLLFPIWIILLPMPYMTCALIHVVLGHGLWGKRIILGCQIPVLKYPLSPKQTHVILQHVYLRLCYFWTPYVEFIKYKVHHANDKKVDTIMYCII